MELPLDKRIALMARLGEYLDSPAPELDAIIAAAARENPWFTPGFIRLALHNCCNELLRPELLHSWARHYEVPDRLSAAETGIVMAGNIPLVGFHDFLCGFISGHPLRIKLSSKDAVLLPHLLEQLYRWEPATLQRVRIAPQLKDCAAYIATGSDNSARYFDYYFSKYPHIIRRNRTSVALLDGSETTEELSLLADDICLYFGLGCRNVTQLYVPEGYDFIPLLEALKKYVEFGEHHKYRNNYDYNLALQLLNNQPYLSTGFMLLTDDASPYSPISVLHYQTYAPGDRPGERLMADERIQCIAGHGHLPFGKAQQPGLTDYADGIDTMTFFRGLR
ncbi:acyl-CoA reductase [Compostibacter hankyongensis]|uniref:Acyl-CoA reductase n=1 Tax=Compostibacter hankyongensis TaxID=1007089 RepID=A0ABP8G3Y7_9BACT